MPREKFDSTNQKHYPDLGSDASSCGIFALVSETSFRGETSGGVANIGFFSGYCTAFKLLRKEILYLTFKKICVKSNMATIERFNGR